MAKTDYFEPSDPICASVKAFEQELQQRESNDGVVISAIGQEFQASHPQNRENWLQYDLPLPGAAPATALTLCTVPANAVDDGDAYKQFVLSQLKSFTFVDSAVLYLGNTDTETVLLRAGTSGQSLATTPQPAAADAPALPPFVANVLSSAAGVLWTQAKALPAMNGYDGIAKDSFRVFEGLQGPSGVPMRALYYECKFDIDDDGSGGNASNDPAHQSKTTLRDPSGQSMDATSDNFAVIPLDALDAAKAHANEGDIALKNTNLPDFGGDPTSATEPGLGLKVGDLGVAFWSKPSGGAAQPQFFIYGDLGPANKLGEGSVRLADQLGVHDGPDSTAVDLAAIQSHKPGVVHIGFPGSGSAFIVPKRSTWSQLVPDHFQDVARKFYNAFLSQPAAAPAAAAPAPAAAAVAGPAAVVGPAAAGGAVTVTATCAAIAAQAVSEWNAWGNSVPGHIGLVESKPEALPRIEEYWTVGVEDPHPGDYETPWSAAFISWCMRTGGAGSAFLYAGAHCVYISRAIRDKMDGNTASAFLGYRLTEYAPQVGDLACWAREPGISYTEQNGGSYEGHSDIVVAVHAGSVEVIGGNVSQSVTRRYLVTDSNGFLKPAGNTEYLIAVIQNKLA